MRVHLVDGTYELFRHFFAVPAHRDPAGIDVGAVRGVVSSLLGLLSEGATHIGVATDTVVESFRNDLWPGYKTGEGIEPVLKDQFPILDEAVTALGVALFPMVDREADDAMASAAMVATADPAVEQILLCTPDKDLCQCVGGRTVQFDRRKGVTLDSEGVREKFGVLPESIPDYLALVGDSADGFPGLRGWGAKSAAKVLAHYGHIEDIPDSANVWAVKVRGAAKLAETLAGGRELALLFKDLATLRPDPPVIETVEELRWTGPRPEFEAFCERIGARGQYHRAVALAEKRS
jgi:5'-3' exonuclease